MTDKKGIKIRDYSATNTINDFCRILKVENWRSVMSSTCTTLAFQLRYERSFKSKVIITNKIRDIGWITEGIKRSSQKLKLLFTMMKVVSTISYIKKHRKML